MSISLATWIKLGLGSRKAFQLWRQHVRAKKLRKLREENELMYPVWDDQMLMAIIDREEENVDVIWETFKGSVRHGLTALGGGLVAAGYASQDEVATAAGALTVLIGFGFSVARKIIRKKRTGSAS